FSFKIADTYEDAGIPADKIPEHTTGKPMLDILETQGSVKLTAIHREYFNARKADGTQGVLQVDMICAEDEIGIHNYSVSGNTLVYDVTQKSQTIMDAIALDGNAYDPDKKTIDTQNVDWQFVLKSFLEESEPKKLKAVSALLSVEGNNISNYLTISGGIINAGTGNDNNYYTSTNALHVFETAEDNVYNYMGTVSYNEDETFTKFENPVAISAYHYVLYTEKNENGEVIQSYKKVLEGNDGFTDGYYAVPTNSNKAKLTLSKVGVTENIGTDKPEYTIERTAFLVDVGGGGANYSGIAYVKDPIEYIWGQNVGNGQLGEIESAKTKPDFIAGIGEFIYNDDEYKDTDTPGEDIEDDPLTNSVGNKAVGKAAGQTTDKEAGEQAYVTGAAKKVETVSDETNDETKAGEAADVETSKDVAVTGETADDETAKDEAVATGAAGDEAATSETADDETAKDEAATAETADGETTTSETANGENIPAVEESNVTAATANVDAVDGENNPGAQSADGTASEENANVEEAEGENVPVAGGVNGTPAEEAADTAAGENNAETVGEGSPEADGQNSNSEAAVKPQEATVENADPANQNDVTTEDNNEAAKSEDSKASTEDAPVIQPVAEIPAVEPETEPVAEVPAAEPETEPVSDVPESSEAQPESEETA
ncbi:MAG: hypothetical protein IJU77_07080, partial [Butyrivibrio sp.]|nr:hypothetical protein [Butyrivibrio sp.]